LTDIDFELSPLMYNESVVTHLDNIKRQSVTNELQLIAIIPLGM